MTEYVDTVAGEIAAAAWHEVNKGDETTKAAVRFLDEATRKIEEAETALKNAAEKLENTGNSDRITSLVYDAEQLEIYTRLERGTLI